MSKILLNMAQCRKCLSVVISLHTHDYCECKCGAIAIDGGREYVRLVGKREDINVMTVTKGDDNHFHLSEE